jgi:hypothetical protein
MSSPTRKSARTKRPPKYLGDYIWEHSDETDDAERWLKNEFEQTITEIFQLQRDIKSLVDNQGSRTKVRQRLVRTLKKYGELEALGKNLLVYKKTEKDKTEIFLKCKQIEESLKQLDDIASHYLDSRDEQCPPSENGKPTAQQVQTTSASIDQTQQSQVDPNQWQASDQPRQEPHQGRTRQEESEEETGSEQREAIDDLGDSQAGCVYQRGASGGERKNSRSVKKPSRHSFQVQPPCDSKSAKEYVLHHKREEEEQSMSSESSRSHRSREAKITAEVATLRVKQEKELYAAELKIKEAQHQLTVKKIENEAVRANLEAQLCEEESVVNVPSHTHRFEAPLPPRIRPPVKSERIEAETQFWQRTPCTQVNNLEPDPYEGTEDMRRLFQGLAKPQLPKFDGKKERYQDWRAQFDVFVNQQKVPVRYKMVILKSSLSGRPAQMVERLGYTTSQYEMALFKLEQRYGGSKRIMQQQMDSLFSTPAIDFNDMKGLEDLSNQLCDMVAKLRDHGRDQELSGYSSLYMVVQQKVPERMLVQYLDHSEPESDGLGKFTEWFHRQVCLRVEVAELTHRKNGPSKSKYGNDQKKPNRSRTNITNSVENTKGNDGVIPTQRVQVTSSENPSQTGTTTLDAAKKSTCPMCQNQHRIVDCKKWRSSTVHQRWDVAKQAKLCFRCLRDNHLGGSCRVERICNVEGCIKTHHKDLHYTPKGKTTSDSSQKTNTVFGVTADGKVQVTKVALRLIPVKIVGSDGKAVVVNAFLDDGSDCTYLRKEIAEALGLTSTDNDLSISTLVGDTKVASGLVSCEIESLGGGLRRTIGARTLEDMCRGLPIPDWRRHREGWKHLCNIEFHQNPGRKTVDLLIGADHPELTLALEERVGRPGDPVARRTPLGWTCTGTLDSQGQVCHQTWTIFGSQILEEKIDNQFKLLWNMDMVIEIPGGELTPDEKLAMRTADETRRYVGDRFEVGIPWKESSPRLPNNRPAAERRLRSLEHLLSKKPGVAETYAAAFNANIEKGYIEKIPSEQANGTPGWYLPHFAVVKEEKETTKVRIVYDAAAVYGGTSLNEQMVAGPKLQRDIVDIMMRFREKPVALVGDIKEMFNQVVLAPGDRRYHRLLWRDLDSTRPMDTYEAVRLVFGDKSSPFLAQYVMRHQASSMKDVYPEASESILESTYMDDVIDSYEDVQTTLRVRQELREVLLPAGFEIRRWCSNSREVVESVPEEDRAKGLHLEDEGLPNIKTLGIWWDAEEDEFLFIAKLEKGVSTKRELLSVLATTFDPFHFLGPLVIRGKMLLQEAWLKGLNWDDAFPEELQCWTDAWLKQMTKVGALRIPRCYRTKGVQEIAETTIHTFTDASKLAYAAVCYIRFLYRDDSVQTGFVVAKARVTPLRAVSIPRLELMAAVLGVRLALVVAYALGVSIERHTIWTDSTDVIHWIRGQSRKYKPFVANRVSEIHEKTNPAQWRHIPGKLNPADDATRGLDVGQLGMESRWFSGPEFLSQSEGYWPERKFDKEELSNEAVMEGYSKEKGRSSMQVTASSRGENHPVFDVSRYSSWTKAVRSLAWILRISRIAKKEVVSPTLELTELDAAEHWILRRTQLQGFGDTFRELRDHSKPVRTHLKDLHPFIAEDGLLRVGGRLQHSDLPFDAKHPIILPRDHHVTMLIVQMYHLLGRHVRGVNGVLSDLRGRYWVVHGREVVKRHEGACLLCKKIKKKKCSQLMAPLPSRRATIPLRAFSTCGLDYGGPYQVKLTRNVREKRYLCLFTCNASRAVHLEVAYSLDTAGFLNAFSRMVARRGRPVEIVSDNGTNFVGGERELSTLVAAMDKSKIEDRMTTLGIDWRFNPPLAPHHGGVFESMIKSAKRALRAILRDANLRDDELLTAVVEVEGLLNSRPLGYCSTDPKDKEVLTPNHFLYGQAGGQLAPQVVDDIAFDPRNRWRYVQDLVRKVWTRWQREYLHHLQQRPKWREELPNLKPGDVVMLVDQSNPRGKWPLAVVDEVMPGKDRLVRTVRVRTGGKSYLRPITQLCALESSDQ